MPVELLPAKSQISGQQRGLGGIPLENPLVLGNNLVQLSTTGPTSLTLPISGTLFSTASVVPPQNGGTGVANNSANTLTYSGNFGLTLTLTAATALTLPTSGTVTAQGNSVTGSLGSIVLSVTPTITGPASGGGNSLTITDQSGQTGNAILYVNTSNVTTGAVVDATSSSITSGIMFYSNRTGSWTSGGWHFLGLTNGASVCGLANTGQLVLTMNATGTAINMTGSSATSAFSVNSSSGGTGMLVSAGTSHAAALADVPASLGSGAQLAWLAIVLSNGQTHYIPVW